MKESKKRNLIRIEGKNAWRIIRRIKPSKVEEERKNEGRKK